MSSTIRCGDKERLVTYVYAEDAAGERAAFERHLATCAGCAEEVRSLKDVRRELTGWQPPAASVHFRLAAQPQAVRPLWRQPLWGLAAAATLLLAVGAAVANLDVRVGHGEVVIRTGWATPAAATAANAPAARAGIVPASASAPAAGEEAWHAALKDLEARLRSDFARASTTDARAAASGGAVNRQELLREVRALIGESEKRQEHQLALRMTDVVQDVEAQRRADLVRIEQNMGQIEGLTGAEAARQREMLNYLVRVSQRR
jgi:hypothetical protein